MCQISVLMSVYNESERELKESVDSILNQSYKNFEFIIVNDNPNNINLKLMLNRFASKDNRIKIIENEKNIGLAMSMNKAAKIAKGEYLARMDADDIAMPERFENQINIFSNNSEVDLICSNFYFIDEKSNLLNRNFSYLSKYQLRGLLPIWNTIHHPTVMMKKDIFNKLGGYRNFPCAQDYDLWLRMLTFGCNFYMIPEKLLKYRIRNTSTTSAKRLLQVLTMNYIKLLYKERKNNNKDSYSENNYKKYLETKKYFDITYTKNLMQKRTILKKLQNNLKNRNYLNASFELIYLLISSGYFRNRFSTVLKFKIHKKYLGLVEI
ncbi:MAG: glycosyl transferase family 2 [Phascolarctobacterium sp.]|nr:MAG: glycosyl transferase family 2 [Phascolarctobacterium sp.]